MRSPDRRALLVLMDVLISVGVFLAAVRIRFGPGFQSVWEQTLGLPELWVFVPVLVVGIVVVFWAVGVYRVETHWSLRSELTDLVRAITVAALVILSLLFWFKLEDVSRKTLLGFFGGLAVSTFSVRIVLGRWLSHSSEIRTLIVGGHDVDRFLEVTGRTIVGGLDFPDNKGVANLGSIRDLPDVLSTQVVDEVIVCLPTERWDLLDSIAGVCQEQGTGLRVPVDVVRFVLRHSRIEDVGGTPMLLVVTTPQDHAALVLKRVGDVMGASLGLVASIPVVAVLIPMLLLSQGPPLFFRQIRGGLSGRPFTVFKFRTMRNGADAEKGSLAELNEREGPAFKVTNDPRVTRLGRWMRRSSFDEVPQLWNVLRGEMSLVGPRPQPIEEVRAYDAWHRRRLSVKPGITGLWQVTSRHDPSFDKWVDLDLDYIDRWSLWMDMKILAKTPIALVKSPGE